jgi:hypothetical protein
MWIIKESQLKEFRTEHPDAMGPTLGQQYRKPRFCGATTKRAGSVGSLPAVVIATSVPVGR